MDKQAVAGVEVSADVLMVVFDDGQLRSSEFPNTAAGHQQLLRFLRKNAAQVRVCMESTGLYGLDAALALHRQPRIEIMVANPRSVRHFGCFAPTTVICWPMASSRWSPWWRPCANCSTASMASSKPYNPSIPRSCSLFQCQSRPLKNACM